VLGFLVGPLALSLSSTVSEGLLSCSPGRIAEAVAKVVSPSMTMLSPGITWHVLSRWLIPHLGFSLQCDEYCP